MTTVLLIKPGIACEQLAPVKLPLVNKFYRQVKAHSKASGGDIVWVARNTEAGDTAAPIVAAARLAPLAAAKPANFWLLTGVYVADSHRNLGIASQLINELTYRQPGCYTFALAHLSQFYKKLGFIEVSVGDLPCELAQRFYAYQRQGRNIVAMIKK